MHILLRKEKMRAASITLSSPLLGLPPDIRRQIYLESGVCTGRIIDLSLRAQIPDGSTRTIYSYS